MKTVKELVTFIETPSSPPEEREAAISELNLIGAANDDIESLAYEFWQTYFTKHMNSILSDRIVLISHLLPDHVLRQCFSDVFEE